MEQKQIWKGHLSDIGGTGSSPATNTGAQTGGAQEDFSSLGERSENPPENLDIYVQIIGR